MLADNDGDDDSEFIIAVGLWALLVDVLFVFVCPPLFSYFYSKGRCECSSMMQANVLSGIVPIPVPIIISLF